MTAEQQQGSATPADPPVLPAHGRPPASPELEKMGRATENGAHVIGEFLDWLSENGYHIAQFSKADDRLYLPHISPQRLIAGFFQVDLDKVEQERRALLEYLRVPHEARA